MIILTNTLAIYYGQSFTKVYVLFMRIFIKINYMQCNKIFIFWQNFCEWLCVFIFFSIVISIGSLRPSFLEIFIIYVFYTVTTIITVIIILISFIFWYCFHFLKHMTMQPSILCRIIDDILLTIRALHFIPS